MVENECFAFTDETLLSNVLAGMASGGIASAVANPTDVLKVMAVVMLLVLSMSLRVCLCRYVCRVPQTVSTQKGRVVLTSSGRSTRRKDFLGSTG